MRLGLKLGLDTQKLTKVDLGVLIYESDFSVNTNGFSNFNTTVTGNNDSIFGEDDVLSIVVSNSSAIHRALSFSRLTVGQIYRVDFDYYLPSSNVGVDGFGIISSSGADAKLIPAITTDTWISDSLSWDSPVNSTNFFIELRDGAVTNFAGNGTDVIYLKNIKIYQL